MSDTDLTIQVLVKEDGETDFEVASERTVRYERRNVRSKRFSSALEEFWIADANMLGELDWDVAILTSDQDVSILLWTSTTKTPPSVGSQLFLRANTWLVIQRGLWRSTDPFSTPFSQGSELPITLIEVQESQGRTATVRGRFYKQATS